MQLNDMLILFFIMNTYDSVREERSAVSFRYFTLNLPNVTFISEKQKKGRERNKVECRMEG